MNERRFDPDVPHMILKVTPDGELLSMHSRDFPSRRWCEAEREAVPPSFRAEFDRLVSERDTVEAGTPDTRTAWLNRWWALSAIIGVLGKRRDYRVVIGNGTIERITEC